MIGRALAVFILTIGISACGQAPAPPPVPASKPDTAATSASPAGPIEVRLPPEARTRAGLAFESPVSYRGPSAPLTLPGTAAPDAYHQVTLNGLVAGQTSSVSVVLGTRVKEGDELARITSPEFADAQASYLAHLAALNADHQRIVRLERAVEIGASSRQELDDARAMHASHSSDLERAKSRLRLLGFKDTHLEELAGTETVRSEYVVRSPVAGVVTKRDINPGQVVAADTPLFQVSRLDPVWILAGVAERDLSTVRIGAEATVRMADTPATAIHARVTYIDPTVDPTTRLGQVRLEVPNPGGAFRFGALVNVDLQASPATGLLSIPIAAVQTVGTTRVVYVQDPQRADVLVEKPVQVASESAGMALVSSGLATTDRVVTSGAFDVRAERLRTVPLESNGPLRPATPIALRLEVTESGFEPSRIAAPANRAISLTIRRRTDKTCAKEILIESLGIKKPLPLNQDVTIDIPAGPAREMPFVCGMKMLRGSIVIGGAS